jgi:hypothetical protein
MRDIEAAMVSRKIRPFAIRVINSPLDGLDEYRDEDWDGISCIEVKGRTPPEGAKEG